MRTAVLNPIKQSFFFVLGMVVLLTQNGLATPIISNVVETNGDNDANDTVVAKWTGVTWSDHANNEPVNGLTTGQPYTVGLFGNHSPAMVDRNHRYTNASDTVAIPAYLVGGEYIMSGNDNRDNATLTMDVTVDRGVQVYLLIDNRLGDTDGGTPPTFDATHMQWVVDEGWTAVITGANRAGAAGVPDEVAIDEGADGTLNQWFSVYTKVFPAGTFQLKQADNAGQNMYGTVVTRAQFGGPLPPVSVGLNFGADDNAAALGLAATDVAGAVRQANWNNLNGASGTAANLTADMQGVATPTTMSVEWASPNTWSSTGRGEENNGFPAGPDKTLMTGYIDTGDADSTKATVTVSGIPTEFTSGGYDVLVYGLGGVAGRGGAYTIGGETKYGTSPANPTAHVEDPGVDLADTGTYVRFRGLYTSSFTLLASAAPGPGVNFRAPVNGIQIVKSGDPKAGLAVGYVVKERYDGIGNSVNLVDLLNNPKYTNHTPDSSCLRSDFSANDANECNDCGLVVSGFFIPRVSGPHTFYLSADDGAGLFLSTDETPANKVQIAAEPLWAGRRNYIGEADGGGRGDPPTNVSAPIDLTAGKYYYIEGAVKEAGGGDNLDVAVQGPGDPAVADGDRPIFGNRIGVIADLTGSSLAITSNPASIRVPEGDSASFTVGVNAVSPLCGGVTTYQWQRDGVDIAGANGPTYTFGPVRVEDHLTTYRCVVRIPGIARTSTTATLEVLGRECLRVAGAVGSGDLMHATVQFSTFVNPTNAGTIDIFNYAISGPGGSTLGVTAAALNGDGKSVTLTTDAQAENADYTVTVMNVESIVGTTVCNAPTNMATFRSYVSSGPCGGVLFETYNVNNTLGIDDLLNNQPNFPDNPRESILISGFDSRLAYADDAHENYAGRMRGLFIPPVSGNWVFHMRSDDPGRLYINPTGPSAAGKVRVGEQAGCCNAFPASGAQLSQPYALEGGKGYYVELLWREFGGGDYGQVAVALQGDVGPTTPNLVGALVGSPAAPANVGGALDITQQPANVSVTENAPATFSVVGSNSNGLPICYQWFENDAEIVGATGPSYVIPLAPISANGHTFHCRLSIIGATVLSTKATLAVTVDNVPPQALSASGSVNFSNVVVQFSEVVEPGSAQDLFNYSVPGRAVVAAVLQSGGQSVLLQVDPALAPDTAYTVAVQNVTDLAANVMSPSPTTLSFRSYAISCGFALEQLYFNIGGVAVADLTGNANYPNNPSVQTYVGLLAGPTDAYENYGTRLSGVLIPPVSGAYNFFMSSDDGGAFYLSTDSSPGNAVLICSEPTWNGARDWLGTARRNAAAPENRSSTLFPAGIELVAGQHYYFELIGKEGGGGDNCGATWQLPGAPLPASGSPAIAGIYMGAPANPVGASLAITQQPVDQAVVLPAASPVSFTVAVSASTQGNTNPPVFYQWYRDNGTGFNPVSGGNSARLEFIPTLADNGAQFRAQVYIPGATATSQVARLTVTGGQPPNSPPSFTCGTNVPPVQENAGAQTVPGVATDILPHSVVRTPIQISYDFSTIPDGSTMINRVLDLPSDVSLVRDGLLKLTDAVNGSQGGFLTAPLPSIIDSFTVSFKARIGGGTCCGAALPDGSGVSRPADGLSVTIGDVVVPLSFPVAAEEGAAVGAGVVVAFDTWDNNGTDEAPAVDVKAGGSVVAFQSLDGEREGGRPPAGPLVNDPATGLPLSYRTGTNFADVRVHLDADGTLDVDFKNVRVINNVQIGLGAFANGRIAFGGRTGGANDNQWIDDLQIQAFPLDASSGESTQTVTFVTSNSNPSLFSVQPAVSPNGTLTYTPAAGACGTAIVTFVAKDNGGTANGGNDTSAPCSVAINVICDGGTNACPVANAQSVTVPTGGSVPIVLTATDADGDALTYSVVTGPAHGALSGTPPNLTYTPTAGYSGADSFVFRASDGDTNCNSTATVSITVRPDTGTNQPPLARILAKPLYDFRPNITNPVVISCNGSNANLQLNGTRSTDPEGGVLTYAWVLEPGAAPFSTNGLTDVDLELTEQTIQLAVTDPQGGVGLDSLTVEVITIGEAIDELTDKVTECTLPRAQKRSLIATLKIASILSHRGNDIFWEEDGYDDSCWRLQLAADILWVFEWKVWLHLIHRDPDLALCLMDWADQIICAIDECPCDHGDDDDYDIDYPLDP